MPLEVIYVTRHGFRSGWSVDPLTGVYTGFIRSPTGIPADPALTSHGVSQSKEMGKHLMTLDPPIDAVYSSPYYRCLQTITPFVELKQQQLNDQPGIRGSAAARIRPEHGIGEFFGAAPFDHPTPAPSKRLKELFPAFDEDYSSAITPSRKGETISDLYRRVAAAVRAIIERCDAEGHRAVVLCTHAAVVIALGRILTGRIPKAVEEEDFHAFTCGLSTYRRQGPGLKRTTMLGPNESHPPTSDLSPAGEWQCEIDSDCGFLTSGEERGWQVNNTLESRDKYRISYRLTQNAGNFRAMNRSQEPARCHKKVLSPNYSATHTSSVPLNDSSITSGRELADDGFVLSLQFQQCTRYITLE